jgi:ribonuclease D
MDTESNSMYAYRERVCLIQFSTPHRDFILDPFCFSRLDALAPLMSDGGRQKVLHGGDYDVLCLKRDFGFGFAGLFDTQVAAQTLGWPQTGLAAVLQTHFDVHLSKRHQRANWGSRPLSKEQVEYARLDTHYLLALRDLQMEQLEARGLVDKARAHFRRIAAMVGEPATFDPNGYRRIKGARQLTRVQAMVLRELFVRRDRLARHHDLPPFKILGNESLLEIARLCPENERQLARAHGMTPAQIRRYGAELLATVRQVRGSTSHARNPDEAR